MIRNATIVLYLIHYYLVLVYKIQYNRECWRSGEEGRTKKWAVVIPEEAAPVAPNYHGGQLALCVAGLSAVSVIGTQLRDPIKSRLARRQLTV